MAKHSDTWVFGGRSYSNPTIGGFLDLWALQDSSKACIQCLMHGVFIIPLRKAAFCAVLFIKCLIYPTGTGFKAFNLLSLSMVIPMMLLKALMTMLSQGWCRVACTGCDDPFTECGDSVPFCHWQLSFAEKHKPQIYVLKSYLFCGTNDSRLCKHVASTTHKYKGTLARMVGPTTLNSWNSSISLPLCQCPGPTQWLAKLLVA